MKIKFQKINLHPKVSAVFESYTISDNLLKTMMQQWDLTGANATVEIGSQRKGVTATRVLALGALSLAAKKDKTRLYITVELADHTPLIIEGPASKQKQAMEFAATINRVSQMTFE